MAGRSNGTTNMQSSKHNNTIKTKLKFSIDSLIEPSTNSNTSNLPAYHHTAKDGFHERYDEINSYQPMQVSPISNFSLASQDNNNAQSRAFNTNPIVPKSQEDAQPNIIESSLNLLPTFPVFNWCAKCNASFRVTSDLVHHMRTCHKRRRDD